MNTRREREKLREFFKPSNIKLLLIGESPPASGRFFYSANSGLYRATRMAFQVCDLTENSTAYEENFLRVFKERGCYLTDLCLEPIDQLDSGRRRGLRRKNEERLARQLNLLQPTIIGPVLRSIVANVDNAVLSAGWHGQVIKLPYPGRWKRHRDEYIKALVPIIRSLKE